MPSIFHHSSCSARDNTVGNIHFFTKATTHLIGRSRAFHTAEIHTSRFSNGTRKHDIRYTLANLEFGTTQGGTISNNDWKRKSRWIPILIPVTATSSPFISPAETFSAQTYITYPIFAQRRNIKKKIALFVATSVRCCNIDWSLLRCENFAVSSFSVANARTTLMFVSTSLVPVMECSAMRRPGFDLCCKDVRQLVSCRISRTPLVDTTKKKYPLLLIDSHFLSYPTTVEQILTSRCGQL